jgi:hypothetical protein
LCSSSIAATVRPTGRNPAMITRVAAGLPDRRRE